MNTLLEELTRIEKNFDIYFSDPINSGLKPEDFMMSEKLLPGSISISISRLKHFNKLLMRDEDTKFLEGILSNEESDKITKIQQYFMFKQVHKEVDLLLDYIRFKNYQAMDCESFYTNTY